MEIRFTLLSFVAIVAFSFNNAKAQKINNQDSLALVDVYNSTFGATWYNSQNWLTTNPVNTWVGVTVTGSRVTQLSLIGNNLFGSLPQSIGNLTAVTDFYVADNHLSGTIPTTIGGMAALKVLYAMNNQLSGSIPSTIGNLTSLQELDLNGNKLTGSIPSSIGNLANLQFLVMGFNQFSGQVPESMGNLTNLKNLSFATNSLEGRLPASLGNLVNLTIFDFYNNKLTGSLPASLGKLQSLTFFDASSNQLSGQIPVGLLQIQSLGSIFLANNHLTQPPGYTYPNIPSKSLSIDVASNNFTFDGIEFAVTKFTKVRFSNQEKLTVHQNGNKLSVYAGGTLSNNTYTWYNASKAVVAVITGDSTFTPVTSGTYYAVVANAIANKSTISSKNYAYTASSIQLKQPVENIIVDKRFSIYPNPALNVLHVVTSKVADVAVIDASSKVISISKINGKADIAISSLTPGNYYLQNLTTKQKQQFIIVR